MSPIDGDALIETRKLSKYFGSVIAIKDISMLVHPGRVTCLLGDNGAGKSTLIKTLSGVYEPSEGEYLCDGEAIHLKSPRDALGLGIATVYQDLAMIPLLSIWRNRRSEPCPAASASRSRSPAPSTSAPAC